MDVIRIDERGGLYLSPDIDDWSAIAAHSISAVIDLDGDMDPGVPTTPGGLLYVYFPFNDETLPDLEKLHAVAAMGAELVGTGQRVLCHCLLGFNRSALVAGLILVHLGLTGREAVSLLRDRRPGALYNELFAAYLESLPGRGHLLIPHAIRMEGDPEEG